MSKKKRKQGKQEVKLKFASEWLFSNFLGTWRIFNKILGNQKILLEFIKIGGGRNLRFRGWLIWPRKSSSWWTDMKKIKFWKFKQKIFFLFQKKRGGLANILPKPCSMTAINSVSFLFFSNYNRRANFPHR